MVKLKGAGSTGAPHSSCELSNVEFDLQIHKDETTAKIGAMQDSVMAVQNSVTVLRAEILEEIRLMRVESRSDLAQHGSPQISFGSLPSSAATPIQGTTAQSASSTMATSTTAQSIDQATSAMIRGSTVSAQMSSQATINMNNLDTSGVYGGGYSSPGHQLHNQYFQHTNFGSQPFNYIAGPHLASFGDPQQPSFG
ncbi:uncharacterized protein LOC133741533 isoform X2 [Rosa rugosa]|uniref:uncharacterized protein LOC133741533 isoform X2 n=1 Tax=Rosa rugosa TaxID=74645 RepID=UPI002B40743E|nr:uncharacterized protein LOC133741533 isoform X2 [Rosa rugosa]